MQHNRIIVETCPRLIGARRLHLLLESLMADLGIF
jgi:ATP-dependent protease HslVU (ClpYQ) ATPase subunit